MKKLLKYYFYKNAGEIESKYDHETTINRLRQFCPVKKNGLQKVHQWGVVREERGNHLKLYDLGKGHSDTFTYGNAHAFNPITVKVFLKNDPSEKNIIKYEMQTRKFNSFRTFSVLMYLFIFTIVVFTVSSIKGMSAAPYLFIGMLLLSMVVILNKAGLKNSLSNFHKPFEYATGNYSHFNDKENK